MKLAACCILVFLLTACVDYVWARCIIALTQRRALVAGAYSALIYIFNGAAIVGFTYNHWLIIPATIGACVGTFIAVERHSHE